MLEASKMGMAFALIQEPYIGAIGRMRDYQGVRIFQSDNTGNGVVKAAIAVFDKDLDVIQFPDLTTNNITVVKLRTSAWEVLVVSFYFEPNCEDFATYLDQLERVNQTEKAKYVIVGGDGNATNPWWGCPRASRKGVELAGTFEDMGLEILNQGNTPTFDTIRDGKSYQSIVDVTACTREMLHLVDDWRVCEGLVSSDHNPITFTIRLRNAKGIDIHRTTRIYNSQKANWDLFHEKMTQLLHDDNINTQQIHNIDTQDTLEHTVEAYTNTITQACGVSIPKKMAHSKINLPWWSKELTKLKQEVVTKRRRIRCAAPVRRAKVVGEYLKSKEEYEKAAKSAQINSWKRFCGKQEKEGMWEGIYRVIRRTQKRQEEQPLRKEGKTLSPEESAQLLAETFYPKDDRDEDNADHQLIRLKADCINVTEHYANNDPPFTLEELKVAHNDFNPKKAPGADGLTADICQHAIIQDPDTFLALANKCLEKGHFPDIWKEATVVVLRKPGKDNYCDPKSYRPIGLLPVLGKILEKMVMNRLKWHLIPKLSPKQYGFMPRRSTEDSLYVLVKHIRQQLRAKKLITLISLDIEGAFDSAWWPAIRVRLAEMQCPLNIRKILDSYLCNRSVQVRYAGAKCHRKTNKGCVQGSVGGPILWNILLDPLLRGLEQRGDYCQAFADDVVLLFSGDTALEIERRANSALAYVQEWGTKNKLKFAAHKTSAMLFTNKLKFDTPLLRMGNTEITMSDDLRILGLIIDRKLTFNKHAAYVCQKALGIYKQLSKAAKVSWGLHPEIIRSIYMATVEPIILYAASVWAPATNKIGIQKRLNMVQRGFAQKLCRAYRTVSLNAALVLAGILPLDLRLQEAASLYEAKKGVSGPGLGAEEIEGMAGRGDMPHPAEWIQIQYSGLVDEDTVHSADTVHIYTDGSKIEGKVGAALSIWKNQTEIKSRKLKLSSYCSVYQAEMLAIQEATREAERSQYKSFKIFTDSRSSLDTLCNSTSPNPIAANIRNNIIKCNEQNKQIRLFWVKAHAGLLGNERADQLAKEAALNLKTKPDYDLCPVSSVKRQIRLDTLDRWNRRYHDGTTASTTKIFFPDAVKAYHIVQKIEPTSVITQAMTGHGGFSAYLTGFKRKENPSCICEPGVNETASHVIFDCPVFGRERFDLEQTLNIEVGRENAPDIMADAKHRVIFLNYCKKIVTRIIIKNK